MIVNDGLTVADKDKVKTTISTTSFGMLGSPTSSGSLPTHSASPIWASYPMTLMIFASNPAKMRVTSIGSTSLSSGSTSSSIFDLFLDESDLTEVLPPMITTSSWAFVMTISSGSTTETACFKPLSIKASACKPPQWHHRRWIHGALLSLRQDQRGADL